MQESLYFKNNLKYKKEVRKEHGGSLSIKKRKTKRPLSRKNPFHVTLRSDFAKGKRSLLRHKNLIYKIIGKASRRFNVKVYEQSICGNHIHLLVKSHYKINLQNFFRVVAGHIAQQILNQFPITQMERFVVENRHNQIPENSYYNDLKSDFVPLKSSHLKYQRKFWGALIYSRLVRWGKDFKNVLAYIEMNTLEADGWIPYQPRKSRYVDKIYRSSNTDIMYG